MEQKLGRVHRFRQSIYMRGQWSLVARSYSVGVIVIVVVLSSLFNLVISLLSRRKVYIYRTYVPLRESSSSNSLLCCAYNHHLILVIPSYSKASNCGSTRNKDQAGYSVGKLDKAASWTKSAFIQFQYRTIRL
jgi:hypothetical protein